MNRTNDIDLDRFDEMLSRYMKGQMTDDEEVTFKQLLKENDTFRNKAIATARLVQAMDQVGSVKDKETIKSIRDVSLSDVEEISAKVCVTSTNNPRILTFRRAARICRQRRRPRVHRGDGERYPLRDAAPLPGEDFPPRAGRGC